ncbi:MAG TPA: hypothetical protein VLS89_21305 [Candidatus Nanopelagicales bacterium]|nr:hypothetical protein [Candidatus Nanopelagicales bacterium]
MTTAWSAPEAARVALDFLDRRDGHAALVDSAADAREALAALPGFEPLPPYRPETLVDAAVGRTFLLAGRGDEAIRWLALRAAAASPWVRLVHVDQQEGWLVPRDQVAVPNESGVTAVVGNEGADASGGFIERVRLSEPRITLERVHRDARLVL